MLQDTSSHLYRFYEQIRARRGTGRGIMAFARKFLSIISYTLKNKWILYDFPQLRFGRKCGVKTTTVRLEQTNIIGVAEHDNYTK